MATDSWAKVVLSIASECDSWNTTKDRGSSVPLFCDGFQAGVLKAHVATTLIQYPNVFESVCEVGVPMTSVCEVGVAVTSEVGVAAVTAVRVAESLRTVEERTAAVNSVFSDLRDKGVFSCLRGWRNENYSVAESFSSERVLFQCERAAAKLLGMRQYGVHMNGFVRDASGKIKMWIGRRSKTKQTYPDLLDNTVAGGIAGGASPLETLVTECGEEASIPPALATTATPVGTISYCHEAVDGVEPETEFMYDLQLPADFVPAPSDGEVSRYYLWGMDKIKEEIALRHFKPNCAIVCLKFMLRHGIINPETEPLYEHLCCCSHGNHYRQS